MINKNTVRKGGKSSVPTIPHKTLCIRASYKKFYYIRENIIQISLVANDLAIDSNEPFL